ncbi:MAG: DUF86 domain-containing protein [Xanthobacteraceae bacterium]
MARKAAPILDEILKAIDGIQEALAGKTFAEFERQWLLKHGVQRGIEIISEATRHLPVELKATQPQIRWPSIAGIGNVLRHDYYAISNEIIWKVIRDDLPPLKAAVESIVAGLQE